MNAMKIALCIAGQLRDEHLTLPQAAAVARRLGAEVFVSTWRRRGTKISGVIGDSQAERMFGRPFSLALPERLLGGTRLVEAVPGFGAAVTAHYGDVTEAELEGYLPGAAIDIEDQDLLSLDLETDAADVNSLRMLYKIWRCNEMKRRAEKRAGARFDLVIRMRPDLAIELSPADAEQMRQLCAGGAVLIPDGGRTPGFLKDTLAAASSAGADHYARLFGLAVQAPHRPWRLIHNELWDHLVAGGLRPRHYPLTRNLADRDPAAQRVKREILLGLLARGAVAEGAFPEPGAREAVHAILALAHLVAEGAPAGAVLEAFQRIDLAALDGELRARAFVALGQLFGREGEDAALYLSLYLAVFHRCFARDGGRKIPRGQVRPLLRELQRAAFRLGLDDFLAPESREAALAMPGVPPLLRALHAAFATAHAAQAEMVRGKLATTLEELADLQRDLFAHLLRARRDIPAARAVAARMVERFPQDWRALEALAQCEEALDRPREALALLRQARALDPQNVPLAVREGRILGETGALEEAAALLRDTVLASGDPSALRSHAKVLMLRRQLPEAREAIGAALAKRPDRVDFHLLAAQISTLSGDLAAAVEHWRAAAEKAPDQPSYREKLAEAEARLAGAAA